MLPATRPVRLAPDRLGIVPGLVLVVTPLAIAGLDGASGAGADFEIDLGWG
jgi:hypothetical protein